MRMKTIDECYTSVTDSRWFPGNPNLKETNGSTWFIHSSGLRSGSDYWKMSLSEVGAEFGGFHGSVYLNKVTQPTQVPLRY